TNAGGTTAFGAAVSTVTSATTQTYGDNVTVAAATTTFASTGNQNITFNGTLNGATNVNVNTGGVTTFSGDVGGLTPLASITTDSLGTTQINTPTVNVQGSVVTTFNDPVFVVTTTITSTGTGGLSFQNNVNSDNATPKDLTLTTINAAATISM